MFDATWYNLIFETHAMTQSSCSPMLSLFEGLYRESINPSEHMASAWLYARHPNLTFFHSSKYTGKWCVFRDREQIDAAWLQVRQACERGEFLLAKCASAMGEFKFGRNHVICVYTNDYRDEADLMAKRQLLGDLGFLEVLGYKRDEDTRLGVYGTSDEWLVRI